jgi:hypothetical protein
MSNDEWLRELDERAQARVAEGFDSADEIAESLAEQFDENRADGVDIESWARRANDKAFEAHRRSQANWPAVTDCDRLDRAFSALKKERIIAQHNFTCCQSCGHSEIGEFLEGADGYTFYHQQDTESAVEGYGISLAYGATQPGDAAGVAIGERIRCALQNAGLLVEWNGSIHERIHVPLDWKRRHGPS